MADRNTEYLLIKNQKTRKPKQFYYDEDDDDYDDDYNSQIYGRLVPIKPRKEQRVKYISNDETDYNYRKYTSDPKVQIRRKHHANRAYIDAGDEDDDDDDDDKIIKVIQRNRSPSPLPVERRRLKRRPRQSQPIYLETASGQVVPRRSKKNTLHTKKTQVVYADDEPTKIIKKVIIDPRTGDRETIYDKAEPRKQQKYYLRQYPIENLISSDDDDEQPRQYVKLVKHRTISTDALPRRDRSAKYVMIKHKADSEPVYAMTSKMPAIKAKHRVLFEAPTKKSLTTYVISSNGKYYK